MSAKNTLTKWLGDYCDFFLADFNPTYAQDVRSIDSSFTLTLYCFSCLPQVQQCVGQRSSAKGKMNVMSNVVM